MVLCDVTVDKIIADDKKKQYTVQMTGKSMSFANEVVDITVTIVEKLKDDLMTKYTRGNEFTFDLKPGHQKQL